MPNLQKALLKSPCNFDQDQIPSAISSSLGIELCWSIEEIFIVGLFMIRLWIQSIVCKPLKWLVIVMKLSLYAHFCRYICTKTNLREYIGKEVINISTTTINKEIVNSLRNPCSSGLMFGAVKIVFLEPLG